MKLLHNHRKTQDLERFGDLFDDKPFYDRYISTYKVVQAVGFFAQGVSLASAFYLPYTAFAQAFDAHGPVGKVACALLAFAVVITIEFLAFTLTRSALIAHHKGEAAPVAVWVGCALIIGASLSSSYIGGRQMAKELDGRAQEFSQKFEQDTAKNLSELRAAIALAEERKANDAKAMSWKGRIDVSNPAVKSVMDMHAKAISDAQEAYKNAITRHETAFATAQADLQIKNEQATNITSVVAVVAVIVFLLCQYYVYHFAFVSAIEAKAMSAQPAKKLIMQRYDQQKQADDQSDEPEPELSAEHAAAIDRVAAGFKIQKPENFKTAPVKVTGGWQITCKHCGTVAVKKWPTAIFCSDKCRTEHHATKNVFNQLKNKFANE
jgi:hypothetical protein